MKLRFRVLFLAGILLYLLVLGSLLFKEKKVTTPTVSNQVTSQEKVSETKANVSFNTPGEKALLSQSQFVGQSFNNCGPATLSMIMSFYGQVVSQEVLADQMRPFHNPQGGVDDKSIFAPEFVSYAKQYGFESLHRPNGTSDLLKKLIANDIPVVVRTWLHPNEDIGHFRIVRGYDDTRGVFIQDDSYEGPNREYNYETFLSMWQPFNYGYILVYPKEKQEVVEAILGDEMDETIAWKNTLKRAQDELQKNPSDSYAMFNIATANYYLGNYAETVQYYEQAVSGLPPRMLWYQLEPIYAYQKMEEYDKVFSLADRILNNGNLAYSELYLLKGEIYKKQGNLEAARSEFEKAVYYNSNLRQAKDALSSVDE